MHKERPEAPAHRVPDVAPTTMGGKLLYDWIENKGFTQAEAAIELELPEETLSRYLRGKRIPGWEWATKISKKTWREVPVQSWAEFL